MIRAVKPGIGREIWHHAVVAGVVAITVFLFENFLRELTPGWIAAATVAVFALVFFLIFFFDLLWEQRQIPLSGAGFVDGCWRYAIRDAISRRFLGVAYLKVRSFRGEFTINGRSCMLAGSGDEQEGHFQGQGTQEGGRSLIFNYSGGEGGHDDHFGVGYYHFGAPHPRRIRLRRRDQATEVTGAFLSSLEHQRHRVIVGERLSPEEERDWDRANPEKRRELLQRYLKLADREGTGEEIIDFVRFFGREALDGEYQVVFLEAKPYEDHSSGTQRLELPRRPREAAEKNAWPKEIDHVVPFEELESALELGRLFRKFRGEIKVRLDTYNDGRPLPSNGCLSLGLGFNNLTALLGKISKLYEIRYPNGTDSFVINDGTTIIDPASLAGPAQEYAILARVLVDEVPYLVVAGHTGHGTVAACNFLLKYWRTKIIECYKTKGKDLSRHQMAAVLVHPRGQLGAEAATLHPYFREAGT